MKDEALYFLAEMAVALAVVDAFIPRAEHYMKTKQSCKKMESCKLHRNSDRLNTDIPNEVKMHMHLPYYVPPSHFEHHPHAISLIDQRVGSALIYALHGSGRYQEPESLLDKQEREEQNTNKKDISDALLSYPRVESTAGRRLHEQIHFFYRPEERLAEKCRCRQCLQSKVV